MHAALESWLHAGFEHDQGVEGGEGSFPLRMQAVRDGGAAHGGGVRVDARRRSARRAVLERVRRLLAPAARAGRMIGVVWW
eukprot:6198026-Pleurochrysis_carterae.AAC.3